MDTQTLTKLGLSTNEATLYTLCLKQGEATAADIARASKLKRPTTYKTLDSLEAKGLLLRLKNRKKTTYRPSPPSTLLDLTEERENELKRAEASLKALLPELSSEYIRSVERPIVKVFEGVNGLKKAHLEEILPEKKEILAYVNINEEIDKKMNSFWKKYYDIRVNKNKMFVRSIVPNNKAGVAYKKDDSTQLRETRLVPLEKFPINIEKNIVGNKVAFFSTTDKGKFIITIIENKIIADAERAIFQLAWDTAGKYEYLTI